MKLIYSMNVTRYECSDECNFLRIGDNLLSQIMFTLDQVTDTVQFRFEVLTCITFFLPVLLINA